MANEKLTLQIETVTTGDQSVNKLADSLTKVISISDRTKSSLAAAGSQNPFQNFPGQIKQFVQDPLNAAAGAAESAIKSMGSLGAAGGVAGGLVAGLGAIAAASFSATRSLAELGIQTQAISLKTGLSTKEVGQFGFAAKAAGSDVEVFQTAMRKLSLGLTEGGEEGKKSAEALRALGVSSRNLDGSIRPMGEIFEQIGAAMARMSDTAQRNTFAVQLFGRAGIELIPTLVSLNSNIARAKELGVGLSDAELAKFKQYKQELTEIDAQWEVLKRHFKEGIAGTITLNIVKGTLDFLNSDGNGSSLPSKPSSFMTLPGDPGYTSGTISLAGRTQQQAYNSLIYGNRVDAGASLGLTPFAPGVPPEAAALAEATKRSIAAGDEISKRFQSSRLATTEGLTARITELEQKNANLASNLEQGSGIGSNAASAQVKEFETNQRQLESLKQTLKLVTEAESRYQSILEKRAKLDFENAPYIVLGSGSHQTVIPQQDILDNALKTRGRGTPSLYRDGEFNPRTAEGPFGNIGLLSPGFNYVGGQSRSEAGGEVFVPDQTAMDKTRRSIIEAFERGSKEFFDLWKSNLLKEDSAKILQVRDESERRARIAGIGAGPGEELAIAAKQLAIRQQALDKERAIVEANKGLYDLTAERYRLDKESQDATLDYLAAVAELQARQKEAVRSFAGGLFGAVASRQPNAIPEFFKGQLLSLGERLTGDLAAHYVYPQLQKHLPAVLDPSGSLGKALGWDKSGNNPLQAATTANTQATQANTLALQRLVPMGSSGGGGGLPSPGAIAAASGGGWDVNGGNGGTPMGGVIGEDGLPIGGGPSWAGNIGPGVVPSAPMSTLAKTGLGIAAGVTGGLAAFQDFRRGGAGGALQGAGAIAGVASAVLPLISSTLSMAGPIGAIAGIGLSLLGGLFNSKQRRIDQINTELGKAQYTAPTALNVTESTGGTFADFGYKGNLRTSNFSPYPQVTEGFTWEQTHGLLGGPPTFYNVPGGQTGQFGPPVAPPPQVHFNGPVIMGDLHAIDTQSGADFIRRNVPAVSDAAAAGLRNAHGSLSREVSRAAKYS